MYFQNSDKNYRYYLDAFSAAEVRPHELHGPPTILFARLAYQPYFFNEVTIFSSHTESANGIFQLASQQSELVSSGTAISAPQPQRNNVSIRNKNYEIKCQIAATYETLCTFGSSQTAVRRCEEEERRDGGEDIDEKQIDTLLKP